MNKFAIDHIDSESRMTYYCRGHLQGHFLLDEAYTDKDAQLIFQECVLQQQLAPSGMRTNLARGHSLKTQGVMKPLSSSRPKSRSLRSA